MKRRIYKYPIQLDSVTTLELPKGAEVLHVDIQRDQICLWAEVPIDCLLPLRDRSFLVLGTGMDVPVGATHVGSALLAGGSLVWHVYEVTA